MRPIAVVAALAAIHAPAVPGQNVSITATNHVPPVEGYDRHAWGSGAYFSAETFHVPPYNQRKARKAARQQGRHPARRRR